MDHLIGRAGSGGPGLVEDGALADVSDGSAGGGDWRPLRRVTVVGHRRRADISLPADVPAAMVIADVARLLGVPSDGPACLVLGRLGGHYLEPDDSVGDQGVLDGEVLYLRRLAEVPPQPAIDDFADAVADVVEVDPGRWNGAWRQVTSLAVAGTWLGAAVWVWLALAGIRGTTAVAGFAVGGFVLTMVGVAVDAAGRRWWQGDIRRMTGAVLAGSSLSWWTLAGVAVGDSAARAALPAGIGGCVGLVLGALLAGPIRNGRPMSVGVLAVGVPVALAGLVCLATGSAAWRGAVGLAVYWPFAAVGVTRLAARAGGLQRHERRAVTPPQVVAAARMSRRIVLGASVAVAVGSVLTAAELGSAPGWSPILLGCLSSVVVLLAARTAWWAPAMVALIGGAVVALGALEVAALHATAATGAFGRVDRGALAATVLATGSAGIVAALLPRRPKLTAGSRHRLAIAETALSAALLPIALADLGVFAAVEHLARHLA